MANGLAAKDQIEKLVPQPQPEAATAESGSTADSVAWDE